MDGGVLPSLAAGGDRIREWDGAVGAMVLAGLGWRLPVADGRLSMDFLLRRYFKLQRPVRLGFDSRVTWAW